MSGASPRVAFATYPELPSGSPDDAVALEALRARDVDASAQVWSATDVDWPSFDAVVLRSTWDYHLHVDAYARWLDEVAGATRLLNPIELVRWNRHKGYLLELAARGVPVVPTELVRRASPDRLASVLARRGWSDVAVKPAIGASTYRFLRVPADQVLVGEAHLAQLLEVGDALVQPFLPAAALRGERSFVFFDGEFSHAVRYSSLLDSPVREPTLIGPERSDFDRCATVLAALPVTPTYARIDFLPDERGGWQLGELELIEPELFLRSAPGAPERLARAILRRLSS